jgi:putative ABC transport system permease protein
MFDADKSAYESEIWMDADEARDAFNRTFYGSMVLRPTDAAAAADLKQRIEGDQRMRLRVLTEADYYREQTKTAGPIQWFGVALAVCMSMGASFFAMNTMYAAVGRRFREIGTLRVLGFSRGAIALAFLLESALLGLAGGLLGCLLSLPLHGLATGTFNWTTFAEVAFEFRITPGLILLGIAFALVMGILGGLFPAWLASRKTLLDALRSQ